MPVGRSRDGAWCGRVPVGHRNQGEPTTMASSQQGGRVGLIAAALLLGGWAQSVQAQVNVIAGIKVEGARYVSPDGVLGTVNETLKVGDAFDPDSAEDQAKLEQARRAVVVLGFFEDVTTAVQRGDQGVTITFSVAEKKRIERITFVGNTIFTDDQLLAVIASRPGQIIDTATIRRDCAHIQSFYKDNRRLASYVTAEPDRFGVLSFIISEAVVEDVVFEGLKKTKRGFVRRAARIKAGDVFDGKAIERDGLAVLNVGVFEEVKVDFRQGVKDPERGIIVVFVCKEKRTGMASFGAGYSSIDHFVGILTLSEGNFRGRGERVSATVEVGGRQSYEVAFFEPSLDQHGLSLEVNVFDTDRNRQFLPGATVTATDSIFDEKRTGFMLALSRPVTRRVRGTFRLRKEEISDPMFQVSRILGPAPGTEESGTSGPGARSRRRNPKPPPTPDPNLPPDNPEPGETPLPLVVNAPLADVDLSSATIGITRDTRDIIFSPTRGDYASVYAEQAGLFGGSAFTKLTVDLRRFYKVNRAKHVIALRLLGGTTLGDVPLVESFSAGGAYTIRGYREDRFRGKSMAVASAEYRYPVTKQVSAVAFVDAGDAWGGYFATKIPGFVIPSEHESFQLNVGYGIGVRLSTQFGQLRLDWGLGNEGSEIHFSFGEAF